jgi:hypothetical protein
MSYWNKIRVLRCGYDYTRRSQRKVFSKVA